MAMNRLWMVAAGLLLVIGSVAAYGMMGFGARDGSGPVSDYTYSERTAHQQTMEDVLDSGTYQDLVDLREADGVNYAPFVENADDFAAWQERHELMEERMGTGFGPRGSGSGAHGGFGRGTGSGGCPMWD